MKKKKVVIALKLYDKTGRSQLDGIISYVKIHRQWKPRFVFNEAELNSAIDEAKCNHAIGGFILGALASNAATQRALDTGLPAVLLAKDPAVFGKTHSPVVYIQHDDRPIAEVAAEHLCSLGVFRSYGYVGWTEDAIWDRKREEYFISAMAAKGLSVRSFHGKDDNALGEYLTALPKPAAMLVSCDQRAINVVGICQELGIVIPDQLALLGVDNDELYCESAEIPLSSINRDAKKIGYHAAVRLSALLRKHRAGEQSECKLRTPTSVVTRESTAPAAPTAKLIDTALEFIRKNATSGIGVGDVVRHLGVSRRLADARFREFHGRTILGEITEVKLAEVKRRLRYSSRSLATIAIETGFGTSNHLKNVFKRRFGVSMREYRQQFAAKPNSAT